MCGGDELVVEYGEDPTGVTSPDGGVEYRRWIAARCLDCGAMEEI